MTQENVGKGNLRYNARQHCMTQNLAIYDVPLKTLGVYERERTYKKNVTIF